MVNFSDFTIEVAIPCLCLIAIGAAYLYFAIGYISR
jgi:hypothetical protein